MIPKCHQCDSMYINGLYCHETGCYNQGKVWSDDTQEWESTYHCPECGCQYNNEGDADECCAIIWEEL